MIGRVIRELIALVSRLVRCDCMAMHCFVNETNLIIWKQYTNKSYACLCIKINYQKNRETCKYRYLYEYKHNSPVHKLSLVSKVYGVRGICMMRTQNKRDADGGEDGGDWATQIGCQECCFEWTMTLNGKRPQPNSGSLQCRRESVLNTILIYALIRMQMWWLCRYVASVKVWLLRSVRYRSAKECEV